MDIIFQVIPGAGGGIGKIRLNRPQNLNALTLPMCVAIHRQLAQWAKQSTIKAVIITGAGDRAFCAGGDVRSIYELCVNVHREDEAFDFFEQEYDMNQAIFEFPKPYIAFLDGITLGGGVGVSIHGSHSIATPRLVWAMPETGIGFFPDVGVAYHLAKLPGQVGNYLALTGERLKAADAYQLGLVQAIIPSERLSDLERTIMATPFDSADFDAVTNIIKAFHQHAEASLNVFKINQSFAKNSVEQIFHDLAQSEDDWSQATLKNLKRQSPFSLKITREHLRRCHSLSFKEVMLENKRLVRHFLRGHDFMEGIRAAVIDKDRSPQWRPAQLCEVSDRLVQEYFDD